MFFGIYIEIRGSNVVFGWEELKFKMEGMERNLNFNIGKCSKNFVPSFHS